MCSKQEVSRAIGTALYSKTDAYVPVLRRDPRSVDIEVDGRLLTVPKDQVSRFREQSLAGLIAERKRAAEADEAAVSGEELMAEREPLDETDAASHVEISARGLIGDLRALIALGNREVEVESQEVARLSDLLGQAQEDIVPADDDALGDMAEIAMDEMPLAVEATTTFEVVLGVGGPDTRLCFECDRIADETEAARRQGGFVYEIRRVFYVYSWVGSAEVELTGEDRETAEAFGRRVVPELGE